MTMRARGALDIVIPAKLVPAKAGSGNPLLVSKLRKDLCIYSGCPDTGMLPHSENGYNRNIKQSGKLQAQVTCARHDISQRFSTAC
jgi:hypothetical protein